MWIIKIPDCPPDAEVHLDAIHVSVVGASLTPPGRLRRRPKTIDMIMIDHPRRVRYQKRVVPCGIKQQSSKLVDEYGTEGLGDQD